MGFSILAVGDRCGWGLAQPLATPFQHVGKLINSLRRADQPEHVAALAGFMVEPLATFRPGELDAERLARIAVYVPGHPLPSLAVACGE